MASSTSPVRSFQRERSADGASEGRQRKTSLGQRPTSNVLAGRGTGGAATSSSRYQTGNLASTSSTSSIRRHSLFGTDDRVVLDIGSRVTKIGFSGEARPRAIFWSLEGVPACSSQQGMLWTSDLCRCSNDEERKLVELQLKARLTILLRAIFHQRLLVDPKQRKVILVENVLMPTVVKRTICQILFENLQVPSVCFLPSHLLSTVAIGRTSSIVLDLGYQEASLLPIQHGRGLTSSHLLISPRSGKRVARRLRALLLHHATFVPLPTSGNSGTLSGLKGKMTSEMLTPDFLDEIKAKTLLVGEPPGRVQDKQEESVTHTVENQQQDWAAGKPFAESDEADDEVLMRVLEKKYKQGSKAKDMVVSLPPLPREAVTPASNPATFGAPPLPLTSGRGALLIPGWVRERAAEVLFEPSDEDELNLVDMILTTLIKLPIDLRASLARNIYVVGGTAMLPGLAHRLRVEVVRRLVEARQDEAESGRPAMVALSTPRVGPAISATSQYAGEPRPIDTISESEEAPSNQHATGDDSFVTTMEANEEALAMLTLESKAMAHRRDVRDRFRWGPISSLAPVVAVLSDHAPRIDADGQPVGGIAPSFPVNLSSWIGASLLGCLRVEAMDQKSREMWDEEEEERRSAKDTRKKKDSHDRPSMGSGRGSFLGTVGGLDLGTYGPLSAGARGTFGGSNPRSPPLS